MPPQEMTPLQELELFRKKKRLNQLDARASIPVSVPAQDVDEGPEPDYFGSWIIEPLMAVGSSVGLDAVGGNFGIAAQAIPGGKTGGEMVESFQDYAYQPKTESGRASMDWLGGAMENVAGVARYPLSGIAGLTELATGQGMDQAVETIGNVQENGLGPTMGDRVFEETGSPAWAAAAQTGPDAALEVGGIGAGYKALNRVNTMTPTKTEITRLLQENSTANKTAGYRLEGPMPESRRLTGPDNPNATASKIPEYLKLGSQWAANDPFQQRAINAGFDKGVIAAIRGSSAVDRKKFLKMLDDMEAAQNNRRLSMELRPSDVAGQSVVNRFKVVRAANEEAGNRLDAVAQDLKGQEVNFDTPVNQFLQDLDSMGVNLTADNRPIFKGSDIEDLPGPEAAVTKIMKRMRSPESMDAYELHRMKRYIDEVVTHGKNADGLSGKVEVVLKRLRKNLDTALDNKFEDYDAVNTQYADTITAIDDLQTATGSKIDIFSDSADKGIGTIMRRILSNATSRTEVLDAINNIDKASRRYGYDLDDDLLTQVLFVDELDRVFSPLARTSFQGQINQAVDRLRMPTGAVDLGLRVIERGYNRVKGYTPEKQYEIMRELLGSFD